MIDIVNEIRFKPAYQNLPFIGQLDRIIYSDTIETPYGTVNLYDYPCLFTKLQWFQLRNFKSITKVQCISACQTGAYKIEAGEICEVTSFSNNLKHLEIIRQSDDYYDKKPACITYHMLSFIPLEYEIEY